MTNEQTARLPEGTRVAFDIAQGLTTGEGVILGAEYDDGWLYRIATAEEELNVWDFEVRVLGENE